MKIAISLCGGGSKGSYELGVWEALKELKVNFDIVTGSSIGALNGGLIVQNDFDYCSDLWNNVKLSNIIENGYDIDSKNLKEILNYPDKLMLKQIAKSSKSNITPFKVLLEQSINYEKIRNSKIIFGIVTTTFPFLKKEEVVLNELSDYEIYNFLLASSTCFPFFPICKVNNKQYIDGGFSDNLPIDFAFKLGANKVIAVDLNHKITHKEYLNNPYVDYIYPKWDLGSILCFNEDTLQRNRKLGYLDTMKFYNFYEGFKYTFKHDEKYDNISKILTLKILNDMIYLRNHNLKTYYKKSDYKGVIQLLNDNIQGKINDKHYFIKVIEILGETYELDPSMLYEKTNFLNIIFDKINKEKNNVKKELTLIKSTSKQREYINKTNKLQYINFLYDSKFNYDLKMFLLQTNIHYYLIYVLFEVLGGSDEV